ncbi:unnamed protein product [Notodromas monacha]|uniref:Glycerol-3-phosphate dehydrogenase [NAD(+)] n=1 Tax=Notodromas monacha TaxID=399045 RepID=A0A7R9BFU5_9CRUS|nr:unnamed protein product [Notodromas monacha]CAG0914668.1 unnamed protein product [Notodromas monacha]
MNDREKRRISIIGSGNWGSAIARIVGLNCRKLDYMVDEVKMWVFEEVLEDGRKLTDVINTEHENVKYLKGFKLPDNVVAEPDILKSTLNADYLVFVMPHQFLDRACAPLKGNLKPGAVGISLIKGFDLQPNGKVQLISELISQMLNIQVCCLMGANLAHEVASEKFCETTVGVYTDEQARIFKDIFETDTFRVSTVKDTHTVEVCGALKNIVACGAGFVDGLGYGDSTKAAVIRLGLIEMMRFAEHFYPGAKFTTFFESCGIADLVASCYGGRNRKVSEAVARTRKSMRELEKEMLDGQRLQGPATAAEVNVLLKERNLENDFPLFTTVHKICVAEVSPTEMLDCVLSHPDARWLKSKGFSLGVKTNGSAVRSDDA